MKGNLISALGAVFRAWRLPVAGSLGAVALSLSLAGCGKKDNAQQTPPPPAGEAEPAMVTVYTWDEYMSPEVLKEFKDRTGIEVKIEIYQSSDEMLENLKSRPGKYDVFVSEDGYIPLLAGKRLMRAVDKTRLKNWGNLDPARLNMGFDPKNEFTVPYLWGTTLLAYRKDKIQDPEQSWKLLFSDSVKGHISLLDERMECYAGVLRTMGLDLPSAEAPAIQKAADLLVELVRDRGMRLGDDNEMKAHLLDGSSWVAMMYSGDAARIAEENPSVPIAYFIPREGATIWVDSLCLARDSVRSENGHKFIDFMLEARSAAATSNFLRYASPNKKAVPLIDADLLADRTIYPPQDLLDKCRYFALTDVDSKRMLNVGWRRVKEEWMSHGGTASGETETDDPADEPAEEETVNPSQAPK